MHFTVHIDAIIIIERVLYDVNCWFLTELDDLSFLLHFVCASYEHDVYMFYDLHHAIFTWVQVLFVVIYVGTSTSMQSRLHDVTVFRQLGFC